MTAAGAPRAIRRQLTRLRRTAVALVVVLVVLTAAVIGAAAYVGTMADRTGATTYEAQRLLIAVVGQNAELSGYLATGEAAFLDRYRAGERSADQILQQLAADTAGTPSAAQVEAVVADDAAWDAWAEGALRPSTTAGAQDPAVAAEGARRFERFRSHVGALQQTLLQRRRDTGDAARNVAGISVAIMVAGAITIGVVVFRLVRRMVHLGLDPVLALADAARRIAGGEQMAVPFEDRGDEISELAGALRAWRDVAEERTVLSEQAPMGILRADPDGVVVAVNPAIAAMLGRPAEQLVGQHVLSVVHPDDQTVGRETVAVAATGEVERQSFEVRTVRGDGAVIWTSVTVGPLRAADGRIRGSVGMVEDVTERHRQAERAAQVQRELWPRTVPELAGYQLAGACQPAEEVAGDFYDWRVRPDGELELTVADVMGKGMGAALVMATLRASLRSAPLELSLAERLSLAAESVALGGDDGLFVTVFQARLQPSSGELRYVDAGHGHCAVRRPGGELMRLSERSLPVGVEGADGFREGRLTLAPGATLVVYSDGLVEIGDRMLDLGAYAAELDQAGGADDAVRRLLGCVPARPADDVTVMVLRRLG